MSSFRRFIWLIIIASGWFYSSQVIVVNYQKFLQYPYENKPRSSQDEKTNLEFPKVTICPNGMHSIEKLTKEYKDLNRMAYGELYKGTFRKYQTGKNVPKVHIHHLIYDSYNSSMTHFTAFVEYATNTRQNGRNLL